MAVKGIVAKTAYGLSCVLAATFLVVSAKARETISEVDSIGASHAIQHPGPSAGEMNILVMGLESREDLNDNPLPPAELAPLHAGSEYGITQLGVGGHTTNTLILIHIFKGGKQAVGVSIPRDDWVTFAQDVNGTVSPATYSRIGQGKIDEAYGDAWAQQYDVLSAKNLTHDQEAFQAHEAGRAATIGTVEYLTGVHIDHFVEVGLFGFYMLAQAMGGIEVCLNHPVQYDQNSGFFAHHAGYQHLDAAGALKFVRQRDGLLNGDLDRTHRQQAFIDSVIHQLKTQGVFNDIGSINSLLSTASKYLVTDSGWDLPEFATDMAAFSNKNLTFYTAKTLNPDGHIGAQDVNIIDPVAIRAQVQSLFYPGGAANPAAAKQVTDSDPGKTTVQVYNGTTMPDLATQVSAALVKEGYVAAPPSDTKAPQAVTQVLYGTGAQISGEAVAGQLGVTAQLSAQVPAGTVQVLLGPGVNVAAITAAIPPTPSPSPTSTASPASAGTTSPSPAPSISSANPAGGPVNVGPSGIPCVN